MDKILINSFGKHLETNNLLGNLFFENGNNSIEAESNFCLFYFENDFLKSDNDIDKESSKLEFKACTT